MEFEGDLLVQFSFGSLINDRCNFRAHRSGMSFTDKLRTSMRTSQRNAHMTMKKAMGLTALIAAALMIPGGAGAQDQGQRDPDAFESDSRRPT